MRTFIIVIFLTLAFFVGWYFVHESIDQHTSSLIKQMDNISQTIREENWNMVSLEFDRMMDNWIKIRKLLSVLLDHHKIDNIDLTMARADQYIQTQNLPLSLGEIEALKKLFSIVKESEAITLTNIF